jgi:DNA-binding transcriptional LysR family regulator
VVVNMFQNAGLVMTVGQEASSLTGILGLVTAGVGITVFCGVPRFCVGSVIEARPIVTVPKTTVEDPSRLAAVQRQRRHAVFQASGSAGSP